MSNLTSDSKLEKVMRAGHLGVSSECGPPRGCNGEVVEEKAKLIGDYVDAINVTDNQTAVVRMCSMASCIRIKQMGYEPILQIGEEDARRGQQHGHRYRIRTKAAVSLFLMAAIERGVCLSVRIGRSSGSETFGYLRLSERWTASNT